MSKLPKPQPPLAMKTTTSKAAATPKHPLGTHFKKKFVGYGFWEGCITSFDGADYEVRYEDNCRDFLSEEDIDDIIIKSNKLVQKKVKVETLQTQQLAQHNTPCSSAKRNRIPTDRYVPAPTMIKQERQSTITTMKQEQILSTPASSPLPSFTVGQHVWVTIGREMHSAKIKQILASNMAKVQWTTMLTYSNVSIDDIKPMFDYENGEIVSSRFSKRKRGETDRFVPPPPTKKEPNNVVTNTSLYSPKRGKKAAVVAKRGKSLVRPQKQYPLMKREPRQSQLPKQKSKQDLRLEKEKEEDYKSLSNLYLEPKIRKNEELPSGICLRQKTVVCGLLRCKSSQFRKQLHKRIIGLEREGKKDEIHQILKQMREHDEFGAAGDGPTQLLEDILDISDADDDEVAVVHNTFTMPTCVKRESMVIDLEKAQPIKNKKPNVEDVETGGIVANTTFEPINPAIDARVKREIESTEDSKEIKLVQEQVNDATGKEVNNESKMPAKRGICSPSVVDSLDEPEPKRYKRSEDSIDISTVSSLTFPGGESRVFAGIPCEIIFKRRSSSFPKYASADISNNARKTPSINLASSSREEQTVSKAASSENIEVGDSGAAECIDLCDESNSDQTVAHKSDQMEIIDVDAEVQQGRSRQPATTNNVIVVD